MDTQVMHLWPRCWQQGLRLTALTLLLALSNPAQAVVSALSPFELDANALDEPGNGEDWQNPASASPFTGIIQDTEPKDIFEGGKKDIQDVSEWSWKNGSVPPKDELTHAYAAAYKDDGDTLLYFGADRIANNGDAFMGFWFFKQTVEAKDGKFTGTHTDGDTLILMNFPQSTNSNPSMQVVVWDKQQCGKGVKPQPTSCVAENLRLVLSESGANNQTCDAQGGNLACAVTNTTDTPVPPSVETTNGALWASYTPASGQQGIFPPESFFEGGINLTKLLENTTQGEGCFASFLAETRSSSSFTATLKDFVLGNFPQCKIEITKTCLAGDINGTENGFVYPFEGSVTNSGGGTLYNIKIIDDNGTPANTDDDFQVGGIIPVLTGGQSQEYDGEFTSLGNGPTNGIRVIAATRADIVDDLKKTVTANTTSLCPNVVRPLGISVTKDCETQVVLDSDKLVVQVKYSGLVCNTSGGDPSKVGYIKPINLTNVTLTDKVGDAAPVPVMAPIATLPADTCVPYEGVYTPSSAGSTLPSDIAFSDTVTATGTGPAILGSATISASDDANCRLCPTCPTCPPTNPN